MKIGKRLAALTLCLVMVLGMVGTAGAAGDDAYGLWINATNRKTGSITVKNVPNTNSTYTAYKLFDFALVKDADVAEPMSAYGLDSSQSDTTETTDIYSYTINPKSPWFAFFKTGDGAEYVTLVEQTIEFQNETLSYYVVQANDTFTDTTAKDLAQLALKYIEENPDESWEKVTLETAAVSGWDNWAKAVGLTDETAIGDYFAHTDADNKIGLGYWLVASSVGSLGAMNTTNNNLVIEEKNVEPKLEVNIWEDYSENGNVVTFGGKRANVGGKDYASFNLGDAAYMTAEVTIGSAEGLMDYYLLRDEYPGVGAFRPYEYDCWGLGADNLLSVAKYDEQSKQWVKMEEGTDWAKKPIWSSSNLEAGSGLEFVEGDTKWYRNTPDTYIWFNSFNLKAGDKVAVTWKYITLANPDLSYGAWYSAEEDLYKGWHLPYDDWKNEDGIGGYGCTLEYDLPEQPWANWTEEYEYYYNTCGAGSDRKELNRLNDADRALYSGVQILKVDGQGDKLSGAEFTLYRDAACTQPVYFAWNNYDGEDGCYYQVPDGEYTIRSVGWSNIMTDILDPNLQYGVRSSLQSAINTVISEKFPVEYDEDGNYVDDVSEKNDWFFNHATDKLGEQTANEMVAEAMAELKNKLFTTTLKDDGNGLYTLVGLKTGTYYLKETKAPEGYNKLNEAQPIEVVATPTIIESASNVDTTNLPSGVVGIVNLTGAELPHTGGIGTTIFYVVGGLLVVGAGILLVVKKRMKSEE